MSTSFRSVFIAVVISVALIVAALIVNGLRPAVEVQQPTAELVEASGKCAECHARETSAIVIEYRRSQHARQGVTCLDCHGPVAGQKSIEHRGFTIADTLTPANCAACHEAEYRQFERSRHAAPAWAAVYGSAPFTAEQVAFAERYQPGAVKRPPNPLVGPEGHTAIGAGCATCHSVGRPHADGSIGTCTLCHGRHAASVALARLPTTCGQCHMGPDHSQLEIYNESKHGVLFALRRGQLEPRRAAEATHHHGHVGAHVRDVPHERSRWPERDARRDRAPLVVPVPGGVERAARLRAGPRPHAGGLRQLPRHAAGAQRSTRRAIRSSRRRTRGSPRRSR